MDKGIKFVGCRFRGRGPENNHKEKHQNPLSGEKHTGHSRRLRKRAFALGVSSKPSDGGRRPRRQLAWRVPARAVVDLLFRDSLVLSGGGACGAPR